MNPEVLDKKTAKYIRRRLKDVLDLDDKLFFLEPEDYHNLQMLYCEFDDCIKYYKFK